MTLTFDGDAYNAATGTKAAFDGLSDALVREGYPPMVSRSGDREPQDQLDIWYARMTPTPGNRKVYGTAWWQGKKWYRIHPDKVGIPGSSNHEKRRSNDLAWPYNDASTRAHKRAQQLAPRFGITWEGRNFGEAWHWTFWGTLGAIILPASLKPAPAVVSEEAGIDMSTIRYVHRVEPGYDTEWMIVGMEIPGGYQVTTDVTTAVGWGAVYGTDKGDSWKALNRKEYIALQSSAAELHRRWIAMQKEIRA